MIFGFQYREPHPHSGRARCRDNKGGGFCYFCHIDQKSGVGPVWFEVGLTVPVMKENTGYGESETLSQPIPLVRSIGSRVTH